MRWLPVLALPLACASTPRSQDQLKQTCQRDVASDSRCIELLTSSEQPLEAREEVLAAEKDREVDAFHSRLARLREAEEARQRARTSSTAMTDAESAEAEGDVVLAGLEPAPPAEEDGAGGSLRALRPAEPAALPRRAEPIRIVIPKLPVQPAQPATGPRDPPTPELYLRGGLCLLATDRGRLREAVEREKRNPAGAVAAGALALALVDLDSLTATVQGELRHRGLPPEVAPTKCVTQDLGEVVEVLRSLVGPVAENGTDAATYGRGLLRLRKELEVRAGLPRQPGQ